MKKILLIIPVVFCLVLSSLSIIPVHAAYYLQTPAESYEDSDYFVHPLDNLLEVTNNPKYYFWYNTYLDKGDGTHRIETKFIYYNGEISVEEESGVYTINFLGSSGYDLITVEHDSLPNYDFKSGASSTDVLKTIIFDSNTNDLSRVRENGDIVSYITEGFSFNVYETNMFDAHSDELDIEVAFSPALSGSCDFTREVVIDSLIQKPWEETTTSTHSIRSNDFSITVRNNSKFGVQVLMAIVPQGDSISFYSPLTSSHLDVASVYEARTNPLFVWWSEEWNFFYNSVISTDIATDSSKFSCSKQLSNVPWHFVSSKSSITHDFRLDQMKIQQGVKYDVLVYAVKCDYGCVSRQSAFENMDYYVDYSSIQLVYSSNFWITFPVTFNPNDTTGGNIVFTQSGEAVTEGWKSKGYIDSSTGETVIKSKDFNGFSEEAAKITGDPSYYHPSGHSPTDWDLINPGVSSGNSSNNYNSLTSNTSSFFSFLKTVLSYFPSSIYNTISLALTAFLIIAIIRRVR